MSSPGRADAGPATVQKPAENVKNVSEVSKGAKGPGPVKLDRAENLHKRASVPLPPPSSALGNRAKRRVGSVGGVPAPPPSKTQVPGRRDVASGSDDTYHSDTETSGGGTQTESGFESSQGKSVMLVATSPSTVAWKRVRRATLKKQEVCGKENLRKTIIIFGTLQALSACAWGLTFTLAFFYFPAAILAQRLELIPATPLGLSATWFFNLSPFYSVLLLPVCLGCAKRRPGCLRVYYVTASWLMPLLIAAAVLILFYLGKVTRTNVEKGMSLQMIYYDEINADKDLVDGSTKLDEDSHTSMDRIQTFYSCCGLRNYSDWKRLSRGFFDEEDKEKDPSFWTVPKTCCSSSDVVKLKLCTKYPEKNEKLVWSRGCLQPTLKLLIRIGIALGITLFFNVILTVTTCILCASLYASMRHQDGTGYLCGVGTFMSECCCQHICPLGKRKPETKRGRSSVLPINARPEDYEESEMQLPALQKAAQDEKAVDLKAEAEKGPKKPKRSLSLPTK